MSDSQELFKRIQSMFHERVEQSFHQSWFVQLRPERNARLEAILTLSVEYERNVKVSIYGSAAAKSAIEAIIEGDWKYAEDCASDLTFSDDGLSGPEREKFVKLWENFVVLTRTFCAEARRRGTGQKAEAH
jgi:hypothetical protein